MAGRNDSVWTTINGHRYWFQAGRKVKIAAVATRGPRERHDDAAADPGSVRSAAD
jgi:hypothetical protein